MFLWRFPIQINSKESITEKRRNKVKYLAWNSIRLKFAKRTSMSNPVKSLEYIECYRLSSHRSVKSLSNSIRYNCKKIYNWSRRPLSIYLSIYLHVFYVYIIYIQNTEFDTQHQKGNLIVKSEGLSTETTVTDERRLYQ